MDKCSNDRYHGDEGRNPCADRVQERIDRDEARADDPDENGCIWGMGRSSSWDILRERYLADEAHRRVVHGD